MLETQHWSIFPCVNYTCALGHTPQFVLVRYDEAERATPQSRTEHWGWQKQVCLVQEAGLAASNIPPHPPAASRHQRTWMRVPYNYKLASDPALKASEALATVHTGIGGGDWVGQTEMTCPLPPTLYSSHRGRSSTGKLVTSETNNWESFKWGQYCHLPLEGRSDNQLDVFCDWLKPSQRLPARTGRVHGTEHQRHSSVYLL